MEERTKMICVDVVCPAGLGRVFRAGALLGAVGAAALPGGLAGATVWNLNVNGAYQSGSSWLGGVAPGSTDTIQWVFPGTATAVWQPALNNTQSGSLLVSLQDVRFYRDSFSLQGRGHDITGDATIQNNGILRLSPPGGFSGLELGVSGTLLLDTGGQMLVAGGSEVSAGTLHIGRSAGAECTVAVNGPGSELNVSGVTDIGAVGSLGLLSFENGSGVSKLSGAVFVGYDETANSRGVLQVSGGSEVQTGSLLVGGLGAGNIGQVLIGSGASELEMLGASAFVLGAASGSTGILEIESGGAFFSGSGVTTINALGTVTANGSYNNRGTLNIVGGTFTSNGFFSLGIAETMTGSAGAQAAFGGSLFVNNDNTVEMNTGADLSLGGGLQMASGGDGTVIIDGSGTTFTTNTAAGTASIFGSNGGAAAVTVRNQASAAFGGAGISLAPTSNNAASAVFGIQSDADVTSNTVNVATGDNGTGTLNIDGAGSTLSINGAHVLHVGSSAGGSTSIAEVNLTNGGELGTGTGTSTINATGTVHINGGTFNANGDLNVDGGTLTRSAGAFNLATNRELAAFNDGQIAFTGSYGIANNTRIDLESGGDLTVTGFLDVGSGSSGGLFIEGVGTTVTTNTVDTTFLDWGRGGASGAVFITGGAQATFNADRIDMGVNGGTGTSGSLTIATGGTMTANTVNIATGSTGSASVFITNAGSSLSLSGTSALNIGGTGSGVGTLILQDGGLLTTGTGATTVNATGSVFLDGGTLRAATIDHTNGGAFNFNSGTLGVETFTGNLNNIGGNLRPGGTPGDSDTIGTTTINGDYTQQAGGTLALGMKSNGTFDRLVVNGELTLGGALTLTDDEGFFFNIGGHLDLIDWTHLSGTFDSIALFDLAALGLNGIAWNTQDLYTTGEVSFERTGDLNTDGFVGVEDLDILLANWGQTTHPYNFAGGDLTGDGLADAADLAIIQANWGDGTPPGVNIPEPGSLALLGLTGLALMRRRRV